MDRRKKTALLFGSTGTTKGLVLPLPAGYQTLPRPELFVWAFKLKPGKVVLSQDKVSKPPFLDKVRVGAATAPETAIEPLVARLSIQLKPPERGGKVVKANAPP